MNSTDQTAVATEGAPASGQGSDAMLVVTCRADPQSPDAYDSLTLGAGDYQVAWAHPTRAAPGAAQTFAYGQWQAVSHRQPPTDVARILPGGDVLIVVHGFRASAPEGVHTGEEMADGLSAQRRTGGLTVAIGARSPATQHGALRQAQALQQRLPTPEPLYRSVIAFTWPSAHRIFPGYLLDKEEVARFASFSLANLLADLRAAEPGRRIMLVAHSMGCFLTIKALNALSVLRCAQMAQDGLPLIVDQMVFYAADVNADALQSDLADGAAAGGSLTGSEITRRRNGYGYQALDRVGRLTIYYSYHDNVLIWSPFANVFSEESGGASGRARLGWCGPLNINTTHKNVVAIDCSACVYDHGDYFFRHEVLEHTAATLAAPTPTSWQPAEQTTPLATAAGEGQPRAHRLWTWYTPAELAREWWERFFLSKSRWARRGALVLGWLLFLALLAGIISGLVVLIHALAR